MTFIKIIGHLIFVVLLTALTQIGGLLWLLALWVSFKLKKKKRYVFPALYLVFNLFIIPPLASCFGRVPLPMLSKDLKPRNWMYPLLFRNYVTPELKTLLQTSSEQLIYQSIQITYLDANFPFYDGFPLLPHLSHNDGKKIDLSFQYLDQNGKATHKKPSFSGYGVYALSENNRINQSCLEKGYWQYDFLKYLTFGTLHKLTFDRENTTLLIQELLQNSNTQKIFIEPHLKQSLGLNKETKIRFHGCQAVRHDDHIHLQIK